VRISNLWGGLAMGALASLLGVLPTPTEAQTARAPVAPTPVFTPLTPDLGSIYAWAGASFDNGWWGPWVGAIYAFNGNINSEGWLVRLEGGGGEWLLQDPRALIEAYSGAAMLGYTKSVGSGWLRTYVGGAFETENDPNPSAVVRGTKGGAKVLAEYLGPVAPGWDVYAQGSYATPFSVTQAYAKLGYKLTDKISIGPETGYFSNETSRSVRGGAFISFAVPFGDIAFSGGYKESLSPGPNGYYVSIYLGFNGLPPRPVSEPAAGRLPYKAAPAAAAFNWSGFYVGGQFGVGWDTINWSNVDLTAEPLHTKQRGLVGGGQVGYNWQFDRWVFGVEAALLDADVSSTQLSGANPAFSYTNKVDAIGTVTGRLGYAINRSLLYVDGGWATARLVASGLDTATPDAFRTKGNEDGWVIGAGWNYALDNNWILGVDYKRIQLDKTTRSGVTDAGTAFTISNIDPTIHTLTLSLSYKFGDWWGKAPAPVVAKY
jgi:outer membrane immunogenic protein